MSDFVQTLAGPAFDQVFGSLPGGQGAKGDPGGNVLSIGLATAVAGLALATGAPAGANLFHTEGYHATADGGEAFYRRMAVIEASEPGMLTSSDSVRLALLPKGPVAPEMFGAYGDDSTNDAAAFTAMENWRIAHRKSGTEYGYSFGSVGVVLNPSRAYYLGTGTSSGVAGQNAGWNVYTTAFIQTPNGSGPSGLSAVVRVADGTSGVIFHSHISAGVNGFTSDRGYSSVGSFARGLAAIGGFSGTESEHHGIQYRCKVVLADPFVSGFCGDGIYANTVSWDGIHNDNTNGSSISNPFIYGCRNGIYGNKNDNNAVQIYNPQCFVNRRYGLFYQDGIGLSIYGGNTATNGCVTGFPTQSFNAGHVFGCLPGQETWCKTNSPPSTATNNQGWYWIYDTGAATAQVPQWVNNTLTYRSGGPIRVDGGSMTGSIVSHEVESDQMPILCTGDPKMLVLGGPAFTALAITETGVPYGGALGSDNAGIYVGSVVPNFDNASTVGLPAHRFDHLYSYYVDAKTWYNVNGAGVLGPPKPGWTADTGTAKRTANATYAVGAGLTVGATYVQAEHTAIITRLAAVEAALRDATQTIKAMKDDNLGHGFYSA